MKRALRITGWLYLSGAILMAVAIIFDHLTGEGDFPQLTELIEDFAVVLLWPIFLAWLIVTALGLTAML